MRRLASKVLMVKIEVMVDVPKKRVRNGTPEKL